MTEQDVYCYLDGTALRTALRDKDEEIERFNALVAMQSEVLLKVCSCDMNTANYKWVRAAIDATAETVSAWQSKRDNEILENGIKEVTYEYIQNLRDAGMEAAAMLLDNVAESMASELRAKGE